MAACWHGISLLVFSLKFCCALYYLWSAGWIVCCFALHMKRDNDPTRWGRGVNQMHWLPVCKQSCITTFSVASPSTKWWSFGKGDHRKNVRFPHFELCFVLCLSSRRWVLLQEISSIYPKQSCHVLVTYYMRNGVSSCLNEKTSCLCKLLSGCKTTSHSTSLLSGD